MNVSVGLPVLVAMMAYWPNTQAAPLQASVQSVQTRTAPCFTKQPPVNCEVSGVVRVGDTLVLANDKPMPNPGDPAIFTMPWHNEHLSGEPAYLASPTLTRADKYEGLTTTLDGTYIVAITAFIKEGTAEQPAADALNTLLYWPVGSPQEARIVEPSTRGQVSSSRGLRDKIGKAIGAPYFKIEAMTTAPGDRLLIGVRKYGQDSKTADYAFLLLSTSLKVDAHNAVLGDEFEVVKTLSPEQLRRKLELSQGARPELGISGIEFDRCNNDRFYATTSFETDQEIGGYLWVLPFKDSTLGDPEPVKTRDASPLAFVHKPEGVEVLDCNRVLVVHDDDRFRIEDPNLGRARQVHEFVYQVVQFDAR
ncbi:hypothetical protein ACLUUI_16250 [Enterobacterales bacterium AW_CKDN230030176-1A_HGKHYDSX7]